jgi:simple sugar transport system permease protein
MLIPAVLKAKLGVSEMVNSLMLNYVIMYFLNYLMKSFLADTSKGITQTFPFQDNALIPQMINNGSRLSWGFVAGLIMVVLSWFFMYRTKWGYGIRMTGINQPFVMYSGMNVAMIIILCQVLGGLLAGMGGGIEVLGRYNVYNWSALPGYGWTGITVAILAGNNPLYVPLAAFFMSYLTKGCTLMSTNTDVPAQLISIIQAVIFIFFAAQQFLSGYRQKLVVQSAKEEMAEKDAGKEVQR